MAKLSPEDIDRLVEAGMPEDDIKILIRGAVPTGISDDLAMRETPIEQTTELPWYEKYLRPAAVVAGTMAGGAFQRAGNLAKAGQGIRRAMGLKESARLMAPELGPGGRQAIAEGIGAFGGDLAFQAGREAITGEPIDPTQSLRIGGSALAGGAASRLAAEAGAIVGNVKTTSMREAGKPTLGVLPSFQKTGLAPGSAPLPVTGGQVRAGISSEMLLADDIGRAIKSGRSSLSPERMKKQAILRDADAAGVQVDVRSVAKELFDRRTMLKDATEQSSITLRNQIDDWLFRFINRAAKSGGTLKPSEVDGFIRNELAPKAFTASGDPSTTRMGEVVLAVRERAKEAINAALPSKVRELNKRITERLDAVDDAEKMFGGDRNSRAQNVAGAFEPNREIIARTLERFSEVAKTLPSHKGRNLAKEAMDLYTRRDFTGDIRGAAGPGNSGFSGRPQRAGMAAIGAGLARGAAPLQAFGAPAAGGTMAYLEDAEHRKRATEAFAAEMSRKLTNP